MTAKDQVQLQDRYELPNGNFKKRECMTHAEVMATVERLEREA